MRSQPTPWTCPRNRQVKAHHVGWKEKAMNWKSFGIGFVVGIALLYSISHWRTRPQNVIKTWPDDDNKKAMKMLAPWITEAKVGKIGPFSVFVPSNSSENTEAIINPIKASFPKIFISGSDIDLVDSKNRSITIKYKESTGEFGSYDYSSDLLSGISFIDSNLDGQYDVKIGPGKSIALNYNSKWFPLIRKDKKKYIEVDGSKKEIEMKGFVWKFSGHR